MLAVLIVSVAKFCSKVPRLEDALASASASACAPTLAKPPE